MNNPTFPETDTKDFNKIFFKQIKKVTLSHRVHPLCGIPVADYRSAIGFNSLLKDCGVDSVG